MSMSADDDIWLMQLLALAHKYKNARFRRGAEEHSDAPLRSRACFPEALQEIDDAQTYMLTFRDRMQHWHMLLSSLSTLDDHDAHWDAIQTVINQLEQELKLEPPGPVYPADSGTIR